MDIFVRFHRLGCLGLASRSRIFWGQHPAPKGVSVDPYFIDQRESRAMTLEQWLVITLNKDGDSRHLDGLGVS